MSSYIKTLFICIYVLINYKIGVSQTIVYPQLKGDGFPAQFIMRGAYNESNTPLGGDPNNPTTGVYKARDVIKIVPPSPNDLNNPTPQYTSLLPGQNIPPGVVPPITNYDGIDYSIWVRADNTLVPPMLISGKDQSTAISVNDGYQTINSSSTYTRNTGLAVGYTSGKASVTPTGGAKYAIKLDIPSGVNGIKPSIGIEYNSQSGDGIMGWGWSLSGLSAISRVPQNYYNDGTIVPMSFGTTDRLSLDGNRMDPTSGTYWNHLTTYGTENEMFYTITEYNAGTNADYFVVTNKQGLEMTYGGGNGNTAPKNSTVPYQWRIKKIKDINGNEINFDYIVENGCSRINRIDYTYNASNGVQAPYSIQFSYDERIDRDISLFNSSSTTQLSKESKYLLRNIKILYNNVLYKSYQMDYEFADNTSAVTLSGGGYSTGLNSGSYISKLNSITEIASDGTTKLNPTKILWQNTKTAPTLSYNADISGTGLKFTNVKRMIKGDLDGDGLMDLVVFTDTDIKILRNNNDPINKYTVVPHSITYYTNSSLVDQSYNTQKYIQDYLHFELVDINNDGTDELLRIPIFNTTLIVDYCNSSFCTYVVEKEFDNKILMYKYTSTGMVLDNGRQLDLSEKIKFRVNNQGRDFKAPMIVKGDYDGDGSIDYIVFSPVDGHHIGQYHGNVITRQPGTAHFELNLNANFTLAPNSAITGDKMARVSSIDIDGDGRSEIIGAYTAIGSIKNAFTSVQIVKIDDDGNLAINRNVNNLSVFNSDNMFVPRFADFNGDGKTDALTLFKDNTDNKYKMKVLYGDGIGFSEITGWSNGFELPGVTPYVSATKGLADVNDLTTLEIADINSDGRKDLVFINIASQTSIFANAVLFVNGCFVNAARIDISSLYTNNVFDKGLKGNSVWGDFDNDGVLDFINASYSGVLNKINLNFGLDNYLVSVTDGAGKTSKFNYGVGNNYLSTQTWYKPTVPVAYQSYFPNRLFFGPFRVVKSLEEPDGVGGTTTKSYSYEGGLIHTRGKGFLGFTSMSELDENTKIKESKTYEVGVNYLIRESSKTRTSVKGTTPVVLSTTTYNNKSVLISGLRYFNYKWKSTVMDNLKGTTTNYQWTYDATKGELTSFWTEKDDKKNFAGDYVIIESTQWNSFGPNGIYRRPELKSVVKTPFGGSQYILQTCYKYTTDGKRITQVKEDCDGSGNSGLGTTDYVYGNNPYGNVENLVHSATNITPRTESFTYDGQGLNLLSYTSERGDVTNYSYDLNRNITQMISPGSLITNFSYDIWGRKVKTSYPDGSEETQTLTWESTEPNSLYKRTNQKTGGPLSTVFYDLFGREIKNGSKTLVSSNSSEAIFVKKSFNTLGQMTGITIPSVAGSEKWTNYQYDDYGRLTTETNNINPLAPLVTTYNYPTLPLTDRYYTQVNYPTSDNNEARYRRYNFDTEMNVVDVISPVGTLSKTYFGFNAVANTTHGNYSTSNSYNPNGLKSVVTDPYKGTTTYGYNGFGQLSSFSRKKVNDAGTGASVNSTLLYNPEGRVSELNIGSSWKVNYTYESPSSPAAGNLTSMVSTDNADVNKNVTTTNTYDKLGRVKEIKETIKSKNYSYQISYDDASKVSRVQKIVYPNQLEVYYDYHPETGELMKIRTNKTSPEGYLWQIESKNTSSAPDNGDGSFLRKVTRLGNGLLTKWNYDANNNLRYFVTGVDDTHDQVFESQLLTYATSVSPKTGNVTQRNNSQRLNYVEVADYDKMDQLTKIKEKGIAGAGLDKNLFTYKDNRGNLDQSKEVVPSTTTKVASYVLAYANTTRPDQMTSVDQDMGDIPTQIQNITYTDFDKVKTITEGDYSLDFIYGSDQQRRVMIETQISNPTNQKKTYYFGNYEFETDGSDVVKMERSYIYGPDGLVAVLINDQVNGEKLYYAHNDPLGSIMMLTNNAKTVVEEYSFDAWGRRRNPSTWKYYNTTTNIRPNYLLTRGYTFHEHLDRYNLINMNGRLYDPILGRFLSPDIKSDEVPDFSAYAYVLNNPLTHSDITGNDPPSGSSYYGQQAPPAGYNTGYQNSAMFAAFQSSAGMVYQAPETVVYPTGSQTSSSANQVINQTNSNFAEYAFTAASAASTGQNGQGSSNYNGGDANEGQGKSNSSKQSNENNSEGLTDRLQSLNDALDYAGYGETSLSAMQLAALKYRQSMSLSSKISTFSTFSKIYRGLGTSGNILGGASTYVGAPVSVGLNAYSYSQGEIGIGRFGYRTIGVGASIYGGGLIGSQLGGPWGAIGGTLIGLSFASGEILFDWSRSAFNITVDYINNFNNAVNNGWIPNR